MLADVVPTVLGALGLSELADSARLQGVDFLHKDWPARAIWSEVDDRFAHKYAQREEGGFKTIFGPQEQRLRYPNAREWSQYDLARDAGEALDPAAAEGGARDDRGPNERREALRLTRDALEELGRRLGQVGLGAPDAGTRDELEELGYAQGEER